jgi:ABC-type antimicrobial peptide transport system permease subunit
MVLAAVGIYGVMSYLVEQRMREFGIRMALGASRGQLLRMVLGHSTWLVVGGVAAGLAGSVLLARLMSGLLFNVAPSDPLTYGAAAATLLAVGLAAGYVPAHRATRIEPVVALREE